MTTGNELIESLDVFTAEMKQGENMSHSQKLLLSWLMGLNRQSEKRSEIVILSTMNLTAECESLIDKLYTKVDSTYRHVPSCM